MAQIADNIESQFKEALKNKDQAKTSLLRMAKAALVNERIAKMHDLSAEEEVAVIRREVKKRQEAAESFEKGGNTERAAQERLEADQLKGFLPQELSDDEIRNVVGTVMKEQGDVSVSDFGKIMGVVMKQIGSSASGDKVSQIVRAELQKNSKS